MANYTSINENTRRSGNEFIYGNTGDDYSFAGRMRERQQAIIPQDKESRLFMRDVDMETKIDVEQRFGIIVNMDWHCNTIANCIVESVIKAMNTDMKIAGAKYAKFNFYELFTARVTTKVNESAEKEGNINISFEPGPTAIDLIKGINDKMTTPVEPVKKEEFFRIEMPDTDQDIVDQINQKYVDIERQARYVLTNNYGITIPDNNIYMGYAVTYTFIINIFRKLLRELGENPDQNLVSANFNDNIEFHASRDEKESVDTNGEVFTESMITLAMRPGLNAKLLIKSDEVTEDDDYEDDNFNWMNN